MSLAPSTLNDGIFKLWCWVLGRSAPVAKWRLVTQLLGLPQITSLPTEIREDRRSC